jgi:hypothetical protein
MKSILFQHKRPPLKSMHNSQGENHAPPTPQPEPIDVVTTSRLCSLSNKAPLFTENPAPQQSVTAQCYNCHTTATPHWRKDNKGTGQGLHFLKSGPHMYWFHAPRIISYIEFRLVTFAHEAQLSLTQLVVVFYCSVYLQYFAPLLIRTRWSL